MHPSAHWFNPEHDMALATYSPYYKASKDIVGMSADLSALLVWMASADDIVCTPRPEACAQWARQKDYASLLPQVGWADVCPSMNVRPWGWNPALVSALQKQGVSPSFLPSGEQLNLIRMHSGRNHYAGLLTELRRIPHTCGRAEVCTSYDQVLSLMDNIGQVVLKAPWSGSGRGLMRLSRAGLTPSVEGWIKRILRTQRCIMLEPLYEKVEDSAMEFLSDGQGGVSFVGYSLFETDAHGNYKANRLLPDCRIENLLAQYVPSDTVEAVKSHLLSYFSRSLRDVYSGYFGVDMMICRDAEGRFLLHPLVEVNLRMTMGVFSHQFFLRYCPSDASGHYAVEFFRQPEDALRFDEKMHSEHPLQLSADGRISSGYLSLTPVSQFSHYLAFILMD